MNKSVILHLFFFKQNKESLENLMSITLPRKIFAHAQGLHMWVPSEEPQIQMKLWLCRSGPQRQETGADERRWQPGDRPAGLHWVPGEALPDWPLGPKGTVFL